jgi:RNA polymerase sigma-B factor
MGVTALAARVLARQTDDELLEAYAQGGGVEIRDELVWRFMPFARKLALRYMHTHEPVDDLVQVASLGLLNALDRFEPGRGKKFTSFAAPTIMGELKRHFRDKGWGIHVPRDIQERAVAVSRHTERLTAESGRSPTVDELADALHCTVEQAIEAIDAAHNYHLASLDAPMAWDGDDRCALGDAIGRTDAGFELAEDRVTIAEQWGSLDEVEQRVLGLRLVHQLTQREISQRIGCSQMHVSRLLRRSIARLDPPAAA